MNIRIIAVGKIKERYLQQGIDTYLKRIKSYCNVEIVEVPDEKAPENLSPAQEEIVKAKEGERIRNAVRQNSYVIALAIEGEALSSQHLTRKLRDLESSGRENIDFIIGGSLGLDKGSLDRANLLLSFSKLTFPHQLMRLILREQSYHVLQIKY
ncbi:MAG: 23S rRNA (pseudouridine(1915)-N(3))-methyltransferase RlmH [Clostridiales bacterium]|nr:23S rRNA (pseudouridine(1915)-N(3))-methyltransferase RlmH [Clostridiales bacterium]